MSLKVKLENWRPSKTPTIKKPSETIRIIITVLKREPPILDQQENRAKVLAYSAPSIIQIIPTPISAEKGNIVQQLTN